MFETAFCLLFCFKDYSARSVKRLKALTSSLKKTKHYNSLINNIL